MQTAYTIPPLWYHKWYLLINTFHLPRGEYLLIIETNRTNPCLFIRTTLCFTNKRIEMELDKIEEFLSQGNMANNTISAYLYAVKEFGSRHKELNKRNLLVYKTYLIETYKPKTVNLRIQALNKYLVFVGKTKLRLKSVKVQQRSYLENVISNADYTFLKNKLKKEDNLEWYFVVRFLAATGARVSELVQIRLSTCK